MSLEVSFSSYIIGKSPFWSIHLDFSLVRLRIENLVKSACTSDLQNGAIKSKLFLAYKFVIIYSQQ